MTAATTTPPVADPFLQFLQRYAKRWDLLVREVLGQIPDADQTAILQDIANGERSVSVVSGHGVGKTTVLAWAIICHILTRYPQKTVCTAPTSDQLFDALAAEVKRWISVLPPAVQDLLEIQSEKIFHKGAPNASFISFRTSRPEKPEALAGVHAEHVLLVADEASGIPQLVFEAASGSMSGHNATTVLAGNPVRTSGLFFDTHHILKPYWRTYKISCVGHPRITPQFVEEMKLRYGERSNAFRVRVLGEFPLGDDDTIIPYDLATAALDRDVEPLRVHEIWGLDVARFGNDLTALARRRGNTLVKPVEVKGGYDTMRTVGWIKSEWDALTEKERPTDICVDSIGIGAGVVDRLTELGLPARGINVSEAPAVFSEKFLNQRAELWGKGRDWLEARDCHIANDKELRDELVKPRYKFTSNGKMQLESKEDMKKRGIPSPNRADAFLLTLAVDAITAIGGSSQKSWKTPLRRVLKGLV